MILIVQRATSDNPIRAQEFEECLARNSFGGYFEHIEIVEGRPDLTSLFVLANKFAGLPVVIANSDIIFDESIALAEDIDAKEFYCLSRWEPRGLCAGSNSHDAWIFRAPCNLVAPFQLGRYGTDGRLARIALDSGYRVSNPSFSIKALHNHESGVRTYRKSEWVQGEYHNLLHCVLKKHVKPARVAVYTIARNESQFVERWAESCKDADFRMILDTGSDDDTINRARALGITVHSANIRPWRFDDARNAALALLPPNVDLCISLDMDEILLPGWREELEQAHIDGGTRVAYNYAWTVDASGTPSHTFRTDKIHARFGYRWKHPIHETITPTGDEKRQESAIWIHHLADNSKPRTQYLPLLEMAARESPECSRTLFYLGREYTFHSQLADAVPVFKKYLTLSTWPVERAEACLHLAKCEPQHRIDWLNKALAEAPQRREVLCALSQYHTDIHNWEAAWGFAMSALKITERPTDYLCQPNAWAWLPFDLAATAAYWLGLKNTAIELGEKALEFIPDDSRLQRNLNYYMGEQQAFP